MQDSKQSRTLESYSFYELICHVDEFSLRLDAHDEGRVLLSEAVKLDIHQRINALLEELWRRISLWKQGMLVPKSHDDHEEWRKRGEKIYHLHQVLSPIVNRNPQENQRVQQIRNEILSDMEFARRQYKLSYPDFKFYIKVKRIGVVFMCISVVEFVAILVLIGMSASVMGPLILCLIVSALVGIFSFLTGFIFEKSINAVYSDVFQGMEDFQLTHEQKARLVLTGEQRNLFQEIQNWDNDRRDVNYYGIQVNDIHSINRAGVEAFGGVEEQKGVKISNTLSFVRSWSDSPLGRQISEEDTLKAPFIEEGGLSLN